MEIEGKVHAIGNTQKISEKFTKREFVVEYVENPLYPQYIKFDLTQDRVNLVDSYKTGDKVKVSFNLKGREWINPEGVKVYFNTIEAWRITRVEQQVDNNSMGAPDPLYAGSSPVDMEDDLPF